ncbi:MAG: hypothetical protein FH759_14620 [Sediminimonas qiaohouensis]|uniref:Uncharacterized protein n=1 Tax=Sediminimonas qiaohouensis TaxID=552061 RepID=A0A7C9LQX6_9RHOB|nr:hypothetical protein [Sediminimonas qiaohouensis]MTJ05900.1 hypothetical protein [Sediminimonas qiaohouensis]
MRQSTWGWIVAVGVCVGLVAGVVAMIALFAGDKWFQVNKHLTLAHAIYWVIILFLLYIISTKPEPSGLPLPKVKLVRDNGHILIENSNWLSVGTMCAIYLLEGDFEVLQCTGQVINIQEDGLVQVITQPINGNNYVQQLKENKDAILVKPGVKT